MGIHGGLQQRRELRKNSSLAERKLWTELKNKQLGGFKFRGQHQIDHFIRQNPHSGVQPFSGLPPICSMSQRYDGDIGSPSSFYTFFVKLLMLYPFFSRNRSISPAKVFFRTSFLPPFVLYKENQDKTKFVCTPKVFLNKKWTFGLLIKIQVKKLFSQQRFVDTKYKSDTPQRGGG